MLQWKRVRAAVALLGAVAVAWSMRGCQTVTTFADLLPAVLPTPLGPIYAAPQNFDVTVSGPLTSVAPGTVKDDLNGLSGCWGAYTPDAARNDPNQTTRIDMYEGARFDPAAGTFEWPALADYGGQVPAVVVQKGKYSVHDGNRLTLEITSVTTYNPDTKQYEASTTGQTAASEQLATLSGNQLRLWYVPAGSNETPTPESGFTLTRLDCPQ